MIGGKVNEETEYKARSGSGPAQGDVGRPGCNLSQVLVKQTRDARGPASLPWSGVTRGRHTVGTVVWAGSQER